jgi:hypothetical protein
LGSNFTQQFTDDIQRGVRVNGNGNRVQQVLLGPVVYYDFGPVRAKFSALFGVRAENDLNVSFFHLAFSTRFGDLCARTVRMLLAKNVSIFF